MSVLFGVMASTATPAISPYIPLQEWQVQAGDRFAVDTEENMGYIIHTDGSYTSTKVGSGKQQTVNYIGKTYFAATPSDNWVVKSKNLYADKITFGKGGRFLRLYADGKTSTSYGIHATDNIEDILKMPADERYKSMGCVLVSEAMMDILEATYELNGRMLEVVTVDGIDLVTSQSKS